MVYLVCLVYSVCLVDLVCRSEKGGTGEKWPEAPVCLVCLVSL